MACARSGAGPLPCRGRGRAAAGRCLVVLILASLPGLPAAHHAVSGVFDPAARIEISGRIVSVEWQDPHVGIELRAEPQAGGVWRFETVPPAVLERAGITRDMLLSPGAAVRIAGIRARDQAARYAWINQIQLADGRLIEM